MTPHQIETQTMTRNQDKCIIQGEPSILEADTVILSLGLRPEKSLANELIGQGMEVYEIGDGRGVANIHSSIWDAYEIARSI